MEKFRIYILKYLSGNDVPEDKESFSHKCRRLALPFVTTLLFGFASHMFMLANKISFGGDAEALFEKGATIISGRWALELMSWFLPDVSMPWFNGLFSLIMVSLMVCVTIEIFGVRNRVLQILLGGLIICSPAQTATLCYMFTTAPYALSMLAAAVAVYVFERKGRVKWLITPVLLIFSCATYQSYFAFAASFCVIIMIKELLENEKETLEVFAHGAVLFFMLVVSVALYGVSVIVASRLTGFEILDVINDEQSIIMRVAVAYSAYLNTFVKGYFAYINHGLSLLSHVLLIALAGLRILKEQLRNKDMKRLGLMLFCLFIFPLSCYCVYMLSDNGYIHSLALYPFCSLYVLLAVVFQLYFPTAKKLRRQIACVCLGAIVYFNISFNNQLYTLSQLEFENMREFYASIMSVLTGTEGFDENKKLALVGDSPAMEFDLTQFFDADTFQTPSFNIKHMVHAEGFLNHYIGYDIELATEEEIAVLAQNEQVQSMAPYPYYGSVQIIDEYAVVKLEND